ncbi:unnamed protein product [Heterobilharzia americana]|nr:unnamed protein product [Heterobilharzia americana]
MGRRGRRNYGDRHNKPQELVSGTDSDDFLVTSKSVYGVPDPNNPLLCSLCQKESGAALAASCGHQFCKTCVEDAVLPISACPLDNEFIRESRIAEFAFLESHDFSSSCEDNEMEILRSRVDSLTLIIDRLVEHLAIRDMINACQLAKGNRGNNQEIRGFSTRPQISDSESSDLITDASRKQIQVDHERLALSNLSVLFKMHTINDEKKAFHL